MVPLGEIMIEPTYSVSNRSEFQEDAVCAISYVSILPAVALLFLTSFRRRPNIRFHACQSILFNAGIMGVVCCFGLGSSFATVVGAPGAASVSQILIWAARILCMVCWAVPAIRLAQGRSFTVPMLSAAASREAESSFFGPSMSEVVSEGFSDTMTRRAKLVTLTR
jgi:uncharacterized membrane protein